MVPLITGEITWIQDVCKLVLYLELGNVIWLLYPDNPTQLLVRIVRRCPVERQDEGGVLEIKRYDLPWKDIRRNYIWRDSYRQTEPNVCVRFSCLKWLGTVWQQFENHPNKESFLQDLGQTEKINKFSEKSQMLIADVNNTDIFELCETSSKRQCPDCNLCCEVDIVYCTCGRCLKPSQRTKEYNNNNDWDVFSILGYVF